MAIETEKRLRAGRYYRLNQDIGPIPAGVYRLERVEHGSWAFSVGKAKRVHFGVIFGDQSMLSEVSYRLGRKICTHPGIFAKRYYENLRSKEHLVETISRNSPANKVSPVTFCMMSEGYQNKYGQLLNTSTTVQILEDHNNSQLFDA